MMRNKSRFQRVFFTALIVALGFVSGCAGSPWFLAGPTVTPTITPTASSTPPPTLTPTPTVTPTPVPADDSQLALTPPMGWNDYNRFGCNINETLIKETADAMISSGMRAAGYEYILIDDCWMAHERDANGSLQADPTKFPGGMKTLVDYIHAKNLKIGLYLDRGSKTCGGYPGSYGYETQDANLLASWGVDYLKYDNCSPVGNLITDYQNMHNALKASGRPIVFSICTWGFPGYWARGVGHLWRTTGDIKDKWGSLLTIIDANNVNSASAGPGHWNDPDMLEVGNGGMTDVEYRTHFSMWAIMAAPLIAGNDLRAMDQATKDILTAPEVIAVDQDPLGVQGVRVSRIVATKGPQVWSKVLSGVNTRAVALFNRSDEDASMTVEWKQIDLPSGPASVRDLWARTDLGLFTDRYTVNVPAHGVVLVKIVSQGGASPTATPGQ
ncbi:MAG: glycoside hydrolase family 27 protein [Anaerolineales bacterium]